MTPQEYVKKRIYDDTDVSFVQIMTDYTADLKAEVERLQLENAWELSDKLQEQAKRIQELESVLNQETGFNDIKSGAELYLWDRCARLEGLLKEVLQILQDLEEEVHWLHKDITAALSSSNKE